MTKSMVINFKKLQIMVLTSVLTGAILNFVVEREALSNRADKKLQEIAKSC